MVSRRPKSSSLTVGHLPAEVARKGIKAHNQHMARCRARTENGTGPLCNNKVKKDGLRCHLHKGLPTAPPRLSKAAASRSPKAPSPGRPASTANLHSRGVEQQRKTAAKEARMEEKRRERVKAAADYCSSLFAEGWADTVADRATDYVSQDTWDRLFRGRSNQCKALARVAQRVLMVKGQLHTWIGRLAAWLLSLIGVDTTAGKFAGELASNIPIAYVDVKIIAVARGLQVSGIVLCVFRDEDITRCQCFIDLALAEVRTRVKKILAAAMDDWVNLAVFPPRNLFEAGDTSDERR